METNSVNNSLKRNIKSGFKYNKYFENVSCDSVFLGNGNTDFTLDVLKKWAIKYAYQTKQLALKELKGRTLQETINNIHGFLYNHIQYEIDQTNQMQKSPACAWVSRKEGMDCKSYSIFASTVLINLGIKHYFRKIKQPNLQPQNWTHVFVVIPESPNTKQLGYYNIIDATISPNIEVLFTKHKDLLMDKVSLPHYGLNAAGLSCAEKASCSCQNTPQSYDMGLGAANPTNETGVLEVAVARFHTFLDDLETKGLPKEAADMAIKRLQKYINEGVEPKIYDLFGVAEFKGLGIVPVVAAGGAATGIVKGTTAFASLVGKLIPKEFLSDTFGAVFANGFNLSCWNSTFTPSEVTKEVSEIHVPFFTKALELASASQSTEELEKNFNLLLKAVDISFDMYANKMWNGANWRSCSKEAIQIYVDIMTGAQTQTDILLNSLKSKYNITVITKTVPAEFTYTQAYTGQPDFSWSEKQHGNSTYRQISFNNRIEDTIQTIGDVTENVVGAVSTFIDAEGYTNYVDVNGEIIKKEKLQQAGFSMWQGLLLAGVAAGTWYASKKKK